MQTQNSTSNDNSNNNVIEARLERPFNGYAGNDSNQYINQLIDLLQKKNRNMVVFLVILSGLLAASVFFSLKFYNEQQVLMLQFTENKAELSTSNQTRENLSSNLAQTKSQVESLLAEYASWWRTEDTPSIDSNNSVEESIAQLTALMNEGQQRQLLLEQDKSDIADSMAKINNDYQTLRASYQALQNSVSKKSAELATTLDKISEINSEKDNVLQTLRREVEMFKGENVSLQKEINKRKAAFDALAKRYQETKKLRDKALTDLDKARATVASKQNALQSAESSLQSTRRQLTALQSRYTELETSLKALTQPMQRITQPQTTPAGQ